MREDIQSLIKFWQILLADKKYLKTTMVSDLAADNVSQMNLGADFRGSMDFNTLNQARITPTGWINTVPMSSNVSTLSKRSSGFKGSQYAKNKENNNFTDCFLKDYIRKRNLILSLLAVEIEFLITWYNPLSLPDLAISGDESVLKWRAQPANERNLKETTRLAWNISPNLAVFLPSRFKNVEIVQEITRLVQLYPMSVCHIPEAIEYLVTTELILQERTEVRPVAFLLVDYLIFTFSVPLFSSISCSPGVKYHPCKLCRTFRVDIQTTLRPFSLPFAI